jgi:hypothetical protein
MRVSKSVPIIFLASRVAATPALEPPRAAAAIAPARRDYSLSFE